MSIIGVMDRSLLRYADGLDEDVFLSTADDKDGARSFGHWLTVSTLLTYFQAGVNIVPGTVGTLVSIRVPDDTTDALKVLSPALREDADLVLSKQNVDNGWIGETLLEMLDDTGEDLHLNYAELLEGNKFNIHKLRDPIASTFAYTEEDGFITLSFEMDSYDSVVEVKADSITSPNTSTGTSVLTPAPDGGFYKSGLLDCVQQVMTKLGQQETAKLH